MSRILVACLVLAACSTPSDDPTTTAAGSAIEGTVTLEEVYFEQGSCQGTGGYDDLAAGANVVIKDGDGGIIGTGSLSAGTTIPGGTSLGDDFYFCQFSFTAPLSEQADFYTVEIAGRGGPVYSHAEMEAANWRVDLTLD